MAINPKELCIGNFIQVGEIISTIDYIEQDCVHLAGNGIHNRSNQLKNILITDEWLRKASFSEFMGDFEKWIIDEYGTRFKLQFRIIDGKILFWLDNKRVQIEYLHKLQNLVQVLTGKELTFNL